MRITDSLFYFNTKNNYQSSMKKLYDVNNQISTGSKIQNSYEDSGIYVDTMRLNHEVTTLDQVKKTSSKAQTFANNTDATMNQFNDTLLKFKTKLIQSANASNSKTSLEALANDLSAMRDQLKSVANTSINGQFLFSGSALDVKPINNDGTYNGNDQSLEASIGSGVKLSYNIDGKTLFQGRDSDYKKIVSTNVIQYNQTTLSDSGDKVYIKAGDSIQDLVGGDATTNGKPVFYLSGRKPDGTTFNNKFAISITSKVSDLLDSIGTSFGNTSTNKVVDVNLNDYGQIEVKDLKNGNSLLSMHIFGAIDRTSNGAVGNADKTDIDNLTSVDIISFDKSNFANASGVTLADTATYTRKNFEKSGNDLLGNVSQIVKSTNEFAIPSTKLVDVSGVVPLSGVNLKLSGVNQSGTSFDAQINLSNSAGGSTFTLDGGSTNYTIFDANGNPTKADDMTYQQLSDVIEMITTNSLPTDTNGTAGIQADEYNTAITTAKNSVEVSLNYQGKIKIHDKTTSTSKIEFAMYDDNADKFSDDTTATSITTATSMSFMANDAVAIQAPRIDFFKELDEMISAVRNGKFSMDANSGDPRNLGIENSILKIDHISDHIAKQHTKIGSYSNALQSASERADFLSLNVKTVRSKIADVDLAEAYMNFTQLSNNYQAMLSTISKINSMSLLNYM
ncbi:MAG: hypothetical protein GXP61_04675 [Epsilonproteobacteria bacterium]|nr:hypothetical protein [Campylobacterota bacterium]